MSAQEKHTAAIRYGALCLLVANDTMLVLLMRLSRVQRVALGPRYLASTAVFCAEVLKLLVCGVVVWRQSGARFCETLRHQVLVPREVVKLSLPAFLSGQEKGAKFPTSKAHISVVSHSVWLIFGRVIISRHDLDRERLSLERTRAERPR